MNSLSPRTLRTIVTVVLGFILVGILAGYIYVGMYYAKMGDKVADVPPENTPAPSKRDQILEALSNAPAPDPAKRAEVLSSLNKTAPQTPIDQAKRQKVLDALSGNGAQNPQ